MTGATLNITCLEQHRSLQPHANVLITSDWLQTASDADLKKLRRLIREEGPKHGFGYRFTFDVVDRSQIKHISKYVTGNKHAVIERKYGGIAEEVVKDRQLPTAMARGQRRLRATPKLMPPEGAYLAHLNAQRAGESEETRAASEEVYRQRVEDRKRDYAVLQRFKQAKEQAALVARMNTQPRVVLEDRETVRLREERRRAEEHKRMLDAMTPEERTAYRESASKHMAEVREAYARKMDAWMEAIDKRKREASASPPRHEAEA